MKKIIVLLFLFMFLPDISNAAIGGYDAGTLNVQNVRDMRSHEIATRAKNKSAIVSTKTQPKQVEPAANSQIKTVTFINNKAISSSELNYVIKDKINAPMTPENVALIRKDIMKYYQSRGYFSAVALITSQDPQTGELVIEIRESGRNSIIIQQ